MSRIRNFCIDIETYSDVELPKCGVYKYVEGDFHILLFAYAFDDEEVKIGFFRHGFRQQKVTGNGLLHQLFIDQDTSVVDALVHVVVVPLMRHHREDLQPLADIPLGTDILHAIIFELLPAFGMVVERLREDAVMKDQKLKWCIYWKQIKRHRF